MFVTQLLVAVVIGLIFAALLRLIFRHPGGSTGLLFVFVLFFLVAWASGLWLRPWGPAVYGVYWLPSIVATLLIFVLFAALTGSRPRTRREAREQVRTQQAALTVFGILFWTAVLVLIAAVVLGYLTA